MIIPIATIFVSRASSILCTGMEASSWQEELDLSTLLANIFDAADEENELELRHFGMQPDFACDPRWFGWMGFVLLPRQLLRKPELMFYWGVPASFGNKQRVLHINWEHPEPLMGEHQ